MSYDTRVANHDPQARIGELMAEFLNQKVEPELSPFNKMGKPLSPRARQVGYNHCLQMGLSSARAWECVGGVAEQLERDRPYEAMAHGMKFLDLTGTYRLFAVLLATEASKAA